MGILVFLLTALSAMIRKGMIDREFRRYMVLPLESVARNLADRWAAYV